MDPELSEYYQQELHYIHALFQEFAKEHPKVARRLGAHAGEVVDPYVERLLQSFALTAARSQMRIDRMPDAFTSRLLQSVYPNYVTPLPSMALVRFRPDYKSGQGAGGQVLPRGTNLASRVSEHVRSECEFRTSQDVTLYPLEISVARLTGIPPDIPNLHRYVFDNRPVRAALRLRLRTTNGLSIGELQNLDRLPVYLCGAESTASHLFELIHTSVLATITGVPSEFASGELHGVFQNGYCKGRMQTAVEYEGLELAQSLLSPVIPKFHGHNLLHEYFAFAPRFWFFALTGLAAGLTKIRGPEAEIVLLLSRETGQMDQQVDASQFALFCTPIINLFDVRTEKLKLDPDAREHRLVPYVTAPDDYEVHSVARVAGQVDENSAEISFQPLDVAIPNDERGNERYFTQRRELDEPVHNERRYGTHKLFTRTHTWISLLEHDRRPDESGIRHLVLDAWLTNGDLPCMLPRDGVDDLIVEGAQCVASVGFVRAPTSPKPPLARGDATWVLSSQLSLDYAAFDDKGASPTGDALRTLLRPYVAAGDPVMQRQLDSLIGASARPINKMHRDADGPGFGRGIEVTLTFDEKTFGDWSPFTLARALERYVARHVSTHSFTQTVLCTKQRGPIFTWPTRDGTREVF